MIRNNVIAGDHVLTIDVMRQATGDYVARISTSKAPRFVAYCRPSNIT